MLKIPPNTISQLFEHARQGLPEEVCGYLAGSGREVTLHFPMTNTDHSGDHFSFDPAEQFKVVREVRNAGIEILANYHSHPASPAKPSDEDIRLAYDPNISYVIVSLAADKPDIQSFRIRDGSLAKEEIY